MNKASHWSIDGLDRGAREAVRAAARRSGKSLRGWLDDVICEKAGMEAKSCGRACDERDDEDRLEAVSRRLLRSSDRQLRTRDGEGRRPDDCRGSRLEGSHYRDTRHERDLDARAIVDAAIARFEQRAAESERKTADALETVADLLENGRRLDSGFARQPAASGIWPAPKALARLEQRDDRTAEFETALHGLDRRLADLAERLDQDARRREARAASAAGACRSAPENAPRRAETPTKRSLSEAIAEIVERRRALDGQDRDADDPPVAPSDHVALEQPSEAPFAAERPNRLERFDELQSSIAAISRQLETIRLDADEGADRQAAVTRQVEQLRLELESMSHALRELAPRASIAAIEVALRDLANRVETQRDQGVHERVLAPVEKLASDLRSIVGELDSSGIIRDLHADVRTIGAKLAALELPGGADSTALAELAGQTREIRDLLQAIAARPLPLEKLEERLFDLTQRIDRLDLFGQSGAKDVGEMVKAIRSFVATETSGTFEAFGARLERLAAKIDAVLAKPGAGKRFDEINERIDHVHKSLAARIDRGVSAQKAADASELEHLVTKLAKKIDSALEPRDAQPAFDELGRKIERLEERLQQPKDSVTMAEIDRLLSRPADNGQLQELAELVGQLAHKVDNALAPGAGTDALLSLERQIDQLTQRLDRSDQSTTALAGVERTIGDLFARMEETRAATTEAAERAVRRAAQDILREAAKPGSLGPGLERELADLRKNQDATGKRTHETLAAVHETLERVVDRLAQFEEELTEMRNGRPAAAANPAAAKESASASALAEETQRGAHPAPGQDIEDFLMEPGAGFRTRRELGEGGPGSDGASDGASSVQADFIAAARRAAQQAAAAQAEHAQNRKRRASDNPAPEAASGGLGRAILGRKRPLLLALGALALLVGAYQVARVGVDAKAPVPPAVHSDLGDTPAPVAGTQPGSAADPEATAEAAPQAPPAAAMPATPTTPLPAGPAPRVIAPPAPAPMSIALAPNAASPGGAPDAAPIGVTDKPPAPGPATQQRDPAGAISALAALGHPAAQYELAARYAEGRGLVRDPKLAVQWFEKAADQGLAPAQYRLGSLYEKGLGVDRDYAEARKWYRRAAELGNARAMHNLAVLFAEGSDGKPDYAAAAVWFRKAAELGVRDSQYNLAVLEARGLGVDQNLAQSYMWFAVAAAQGDDDAGKKRDEVGSRLDSKGLAAAKALIENFKPNRPDKASNDVTPPPGGWESVKIPVKSGSPAKPKVSALQR